MSRAVRGDPAKDRAAMKEVKRIMKLASSSSMTHFSARTCRYLGRAGKWLGAQSDFFGSVRPEQDTSRPKPHDQSKANKELGE